MAYLLCTVLFAFLALHSHLASTMKPTQLIPFSKVLTNYPLHSQYTDVQFLQEANLPSILSGSTDALRVSHALFKSGYAITIGNSQYSWSRTVTTDCARYIATADTMKQYLTAKMGDPFVGSTPSKYQGKQGIVVFKACTNRQADYVDLYDGANCKKQQCNFEACTGHLFEVSAPAV